MEEILKRAEEIAANPSEGPNEAAKFLGLYRKQTAQNLESDVSKITPLLSIVTAQIRYLIDVGLSDRATAIAEWLIHLLHLMSEKNGDYEMSKIRLMSRGHFSSFFRYYAKALRNVDRFEDMRLAMRNSMDLSRELPMSIVYLIHLYTPLYEFDTLESKPIHQWMLDRIAECLAALDYAGLTDTPFRKALDKYQLTIQFPENTREYYLLLKTMAMTYPEDVALKTLKTLYEKQYIKRIDKD